MAAYGVNFLLFTMTIFELLGLKSGPLRTLGMDAKAVSGRKLYGYLACFAVVLVTLRVAVPAYWEVRITTGPGGLLVGQTAEGHD